MSINDLRIDDRNKGWANLYMNNLTVYDTLTVEGGLNVEGLSISSVDDLGQSSILDFPSKEYLQLSTLVGVGTVVFDPSIGFSVVSDTGTNTVAVTESFYSGNTFGTISGGYCDLMQNIPVPVGNSLESGAIRFGATGITSPSVGGFYVGPLGEVGGKYLISFDMSIRVTGAVNSEFNITVNSAKSLVVPFSSVDDQIITMNLKYVADSDDYVSSEVKYDPAMTPMFHSITARKIN